MDISQPTSIVHTLAADDAGDGKITPAENDSSAGESKFQEKWEAEGTPSGNDMEGAAPAPRHMSKVRRYVVLALLSVAYFVEVFTSAGVLLVMGQVEEALDMRVATGTWQMTAYQIAFASILLTAGRLSDLYNAKWIFISGLFCTGLGATLCGASQNGTMLICFRALTGIGSALALPSAQQLMMSSFSDPKDQALGLALFAGVGMLGACFSQAVIGFLALISWRAAYYDVGIIAIPMSLLAIVVLPKPSRKEGVRPKFDLPGLFILTAAVILFIYGVTEGSNYNHWSSPKVLVPLCMSLGLLIPLFLVWEAMIPPEDACVPPWIWKLPNFGILFAVAWVVWGWYNSWEVLLAVYWREGFGYNSVGISLRFLPTGLGGAIASIYGILKPQHFKPKWFLAPTLFVGAATEILFAYADTSRKFWTYNLLGQFFGSMAISTAYICCNIGLIQSAGVDRVGVTAAIFNAATQVGSAASIALVTAVSSALQVDHPMPSYVPYHWAFIFMACVMAAEGVAVMIFYRQSKVDGQALVEDTEVEVRGEGQLEQKEKM